MRRNDLVRATKGNYPNKDGIKTPVWNHLFTLIREGRFGACAVVIATTTLKSGIDDEQKLRDGLRKAVSQWAKETPEGMDAYAAAGDDMNIGDLANRDMNGVLKFFPGCLYFEIQIPDMALDWVFDTQLCDEIEDEK